MYRSSLKLTDCFELMIRQNTRSCTHWQLIITSYNFHVYKTLCVLESLIGSIQNHSIGMNSRVTYSKFARVRAHCITHVISISQLVNCIFWPVKTLNCLVAASKLHRHRRYVALLSGTTVHSCSELSN